MLATLTRQFWTFFGALMVALILQWALLPAAARADDQAELHAAVEVATARYEAAIKALEAGGRADTAGEMRRFRESWQALILKFGSQPTPPGSEAEDRAGLFMQVDARIVGAMLVIDVGSRDAAREALAPIGETLAELTKKTAPQKK
jgi:hypothetical protein